MLTTTRAGILLATLLCFPVAIAQQVAGLDCLAQAYPDFVKRVEDNTVISHAGKTYVYDQDLKIDSFQTLLDRADLRAQMSQPYPQTQLNAPPLQDVDPGRLRAADFFADMYGTSVDQVRQNLQRVYWAPCACYLTFSKVNGAAEALETVGMQLARDPEAAQYVSRPNGTFNWRKIQATSRASVHSFAIAIDFALPARLNAYWLWFGCRAGQACAYPEQLLTDPVLARVVQAFEAQGFIWGGKWYHFDSVHFEFRPELTGPACR